ncbi:MAG: NAD(P)H-hydrate dehydratase [Flavobacteriia bacterium]|nr:NAD(P)H-hydrate dehydratase [Flavobacteriia bacterium]
MQAITIDFIKTFFIKRAINSHKGTHGHALLIAGEIGKMGASVIASKACLRSGVGLLTVNSPQNERMIIQSTVPEAMVVFRENEPIELMNFDAIAIGPGIGQSQLSKKWLKQILTTKNRTIILDADALNMLANANELLYQLPNQTILTPHPKEFDRLFGICENTEERIALAKKKTRELHCIIVLKGHQTHIISEDSIFVNTNGNAGLAKGGSGDALTGMVLAFAAQGYLPIEASQLAVFLHGLAADLTLESQSHESMLISDVIANIGDSFKTIQNGLE